MQSLLSSYTEPLSTWLAPRLKFKKPKTLEQGRDLHAQREQVRLDMLSALWRAPGGGEEVDVLICPVAPHPTPEVDKWGGVNYTSAWVLLDYCMGAIPVREVERADLDAEVEGEVLGPWDAGNRKLWDKDVRERYLGSTLSVQVVAPRLQEKRLVRGMRAVDCAVRGMKWEGDAGEENVNAKVSESMGGIGGAKL